MNKLKVYLPIAIVAVVVIAIVFRVQKLRTAVTGLFTSRSGSSPPSCSQAFRFG